MISRRLSRLRTILLFIGINLVLVIAVIKYHKWTASTRPRGNFLQSRRTSVNHGDKPLGCTPKRNIVFLKTHKTGSSTITNILNRYGETNDLHFVLPKDHYRRLGWPWFFQLDHMAHYNVKPNILCNHARYNRAVFNTLMPNDTVYVTILRDPVTHFESTFSYMTFGELFGISNSSDSLVTFFENPKEILINYLLTKDLRIYSDRVKLIRNGMFFDLGLESKDFEEKDRVDQAIKELDSQFHLVMLMEHFDESLVLLRRLLCWDPNDILYFHLNQRHDSHRRRTFSNSLVQKIRQWSSADVALYEHFRKVFYNKLREQPEDFHEEVKSLQFKNYYLQHMCVDSQNFNENGSYNVETKTFKLRKDITTALRNTCDRMTWDEIRYMEYLKREQNEMSRRKSFWW